MAYGTYYKCDSCQQVVFDQPPDGWIGLTRAKRVEGGIEAEETHACSDGCAQRLLMTVIQPASAGVLKKAH